MDHITKIQSRNTKSSPKTNKAKILATLCIMWLFSNCHEEGIHMPSQTQYTKINNINGKRIKYGENRVYNNGEKITALFQNQTDEKFEAGKLWVVTQPWDTTRLASWTHGTRKDIRETFDPQKTWFKKGENNKIGELVIKTEDNTIVQKMPTFHANQKENEKTKESTLLLE